jgi:hypothetical protein
MARAALLGPRVALQATLDDHFNNRLSSRLPDVIAQVGGASRRRTVGTRDVHDILEANPL